MNAKEIKNKLKAISFNFEDSDGVTHIPWVDLQEALDVVDSIEAKSKEEAECEHQWQEVHKANNHQSSWGANRCMICGEIDEWQYDF